MVALRPSATQENVQESQTQKQTPKVVQRKFWKGSQNIVIKYAIIAQQKDKYSWDDEDEHRCRFYTKSQAGKLLKNPAFKAYFRDNDEKELIQKAIDSVVSKHKIPQHASVLYNCSDEFENFTIFINATDEEHILTYKAILIGCITGYTYQEYKAYLDEEERMKNVAKDFF